MCLRSFARSGENLLTRWIPFGVLLISLLIGGCGDDPDDPDVSGDAGSDVFVPDLFNDVDLNDSGDLSEGEIICRPCANAAQCGGINNACVNLPSGESVCGVDCATDPEICPDGTFCATLGDAGTIRQCVPEALYCESQCGDPPLECDVEGEICDPLTGNCAPPLALCDPCLINDQCGENNLCVTFPDIDNYRGCAQDCSEDATCPSGYVCARIGTAEDDPRQCVPSTLTCIERCEGLNCGDDLSCDPLTGTCVVPLALCDTCQRSEECGGANDLCVTLLDGTPSCSQDCGPASPTPGECPAGYLCFDLDAVTAQCVPSTLTCVDHCEDPELVVCGDDQNCDPIDGTCHASLVNLCGSPCENNYECGGQDDICLSLDALATPFCAADCDEDSPCPIGYSCYPLNDNLRFQCGPSEIDASCDLCGSVDCPDGEACRPTDGTCLPLPSPCTTTDDCPPGELCNTFEDRCEPIGLSCRHNEFFDCGPQASCSATSQGMDGVCLQQCSSSPDGCPDFLPECENFDEIFLGVCTERGLGGPEACGRLVPTSELMGQPCPFNDDFDGCSGGAPICLTDVHDDIPGFCTSTCNPDDLDPCPLGGTCADLPGEVSAYCVPDDCGCLIEPDLEEFEVDLLQTALDQLELTRCDLSTTLIQRQSAGREIANDPYRIGSVGRVRNEILNGAELLGAQAASLAGDNSLSAVIRLGADASDNGLSPLPLDVGAPTLCEALTALYADAGEDAPDCTGLDAVDTAVPDIGTVVAAAAWAVEQRDELRPLDATEVEMDALLDTLHALVLDDGTAAPDMDAGRDLLLNYKYDGLYDLGATLALAVEDADLGPIRGDTLDFDFIFDTPLGLVVIQGDADHTYCDNADDCSDADNAVVLSEDVLLLVDTGGAEVYLTAAGATEQYAHAVSVNLDLEGDDIYGYVEDGAAAGNLLAPDAQLRVDLSGASLSTRSRQGSSRGGIGLLFDFGAGADQYQSLRMSQGFGLLGVGGLYDDGCGADACVDLFTSESLSQGAGLFGLGAVVLGDGDARFAGHHLVQGAAGPLGVGLLVNTAGNDDYEAFVLSNGEILFEAPTLGSTGNWSVSQGAATGVPSDTPTLGGNISGGIGILADLAGDDDYRANVFAQGSGYWHGMGILIESDGADDYEASGWAQGAGLDFGVGLMTDQGGDDTHNVDEDVEPRVLGSGENFGAGFFIDESGADTYHGGAQSLGVGFLNGTGVFLEHDGDDLYNMNSEETLGKATLSVLGSQPASNPRREAPTVGIFVDAAGVDTVSGRSVESPPIGDDLQWIQRTRPLPDEDPLLEFGVGIDGNGGTGIDTRL